MNKICLLTLLLLTIICFAPAVAQQSEHPGVQLYKQRKYSDAAKQLSSAVKQNGFKSDASIWNYLGLSYLEIDDFKNARKSFERAVKLDPKNASFHVNLAYVSLMFRQTDKAQSEAGKAITLDPKSNSGYYLRGSASLWEGKLGDAKRDADALVSIDASSWKGYVLQSSILLARLSKEVAGEADVQAVKNHIDLLRDARDILRLGAEKTNRNKQVTDELEALEAFYDYFANDRSAPPSAFPDPGVTPLKIIEKPRPSYTDAARQSNTQGVIRVAVIFGASGKIEHALLLKRLGYGLDNEVLKAVQKIKFEPKKVNGNPVSSVRLIEYGFSIY